MKADWSETNALWAKVPGGTRVSPTCEFWVERGVDCGRPAIAAYPAMGGGLASVCVEHAGKHAAYSRPVIDGVIQQSNPEGATEPQPDHGGAP